MTNILHKRSFTDWINREFARIAFAESGELYPEHPHKLRSITEVFTEVAFAESGEDFHIDVLLTDPPKACAHGETDGFRRRTTCRRQLGCRNR